MKRLNAQLTLLAVTMCIALAPARAVLAMDNPRVQDDAGFFSKDALSRANALIQKIKKTHKTDVYIETWNDVPEAQRERLRTMGQDDFFGDAIQRRAVAQKVEGIVMIVCREPSHLRIGVGPDLRALKFTTADRDRLSALMLDQFKSKRFDDGLLDGLKLIDDTLAEAPKRREKQRKEQADAARAAREAGEPTSPSGSSMGKNSAAPAVPPTTQDLVNETKIAKPKPPIDWAKVIIVLAVALPIVFWVAFRKILFPKRTLMGTGHHSEAYFPNRSR